MTTVLQDTGSPPPTEQHEKARRLAVEWTKWEARRQEVRQERDWGQQRLDEARVREREQRDRIDELLVDIDLPALDLAYAIRREMGVPMSHEEVKKVRRRIYDALGRARRLEDPAEPHDDGPGTNIDGAEAEDPDPDAAP